VQNGEKAIALQNRGVSLLNEGKLEEAKAVALENVELREKGLGQVGGTDSLWTATAYQLLGQVHILSPPPLPLPLSACWFVFAGTKLGGGGGFPDTKSTATTYQLLGGMIINPSPPLDVQFHGAACLL